MNYLFCVCNFIFQNLLGIKKHGNWQGFSKVFNLNLFSPKKLSDIAKFLVISAQLNNQTIKTTINTIIMKTSTQAKRTQLIQYNFLSASHSIVLFSLAQQPKYFEKFTAKSKWKDYTGIKWCFCINIVFSCTCILLFHITHGSLCLPYSKGPVYTVSVRDIPLVIQACLFVKCSM